MKKTLLFLLFPFFLFAQTAKQKQTIVAKSDVARLTSISDRYTAFYKENKRIALEQAGMKNWPVTIKTNENYSQLVGVTKDMKPIYLMTFNRGAGVTSRASKLYTGGGLGLNIHGENMLSAVWDAGSGKPSHQLFSGRMQVRDAAPFTHYHSAHVAGTVMGSDQVQNGAARGMAYKSNLDSYEWNNDKAEIAAAAANGLLLSNHSYGYNPGFVQLSQWGKYDDESQIVDEIMFSAPYYQFVCAAGNSRNDFNLEKNGYDVITGHALSKNGITVAAVNEVQNYTGPESVIMSEFSSWGPTDDGRIKPDIAAKGVNTFSALDSSDQSYGNLSGTSMAAPSVQGTLLLLQQYYNQQNNSFMKAATLRGLMIHTADETGSNPGPDYEFGWGLINAEKGADVITKRNLQSYIFENTLQQNGSYTISVESIGSEPLQATLCWTDPKGTIPGGEIDLNTPLLVNDLDIRINQGATAFFPWKLSPAKPSAAAIKADNIVDNVEKNEIANPSGNYTITVSHKGILAGNAQNYSLIISGVTVKDFWFSTNENAKSICSGTNSAVFPFDFRTKLNFDETVTLSTVNLPQGLTSVFNPAVMTQNGRFDLTLNNLDALPLGDYSFSVKGESASESFEMIVSFRRISAEFGVTTLQLPPNNSTSLNRNIALSWTADALAQTYEIQIATDSAFADIAETAELGLTEFTASQLHYNERYYWRVRSKNSCANGDFSETFTFTTDCRAPSDFTVLHSGSVSATLGWTEHTAADSWQVQIVTQGSPPTGIPMTVTGNPYTISGLSPGTCYDLYFKMDCIDGTSQWAGPYSFCTQPDYCNGAHFYDSGGATGNFQNNERKVTTIFPENTGDRVKAIFSSFNVGQNQFLVYNGPDTNSPILYYWYGYGNPPQTLVSTHETGTLTFEFASYAGETASGWDAAIVCEPLPPCLYAPVEPFLLSATATTAKVGWYDYINTASWETLVLPRGVLPSTSGTVTSSNPTTITGLTKNTCYDFYVRSICSNGTSDWTGPLAFCTTPDYCNGDHFYDTGGAENNYPQEEYKTTTIFPEQSGDRIRAVFNSFDLRSCCTSFVIYNGPNTGYPVLYNSYSQMNAMPQNIASTHMSGALTFQFQSNSYEPVTAAGWDATILCESLPPCPNPPVNVTVSQVTRTTASVYWYEQSNASQWMIEVVLRGTTPTGNGVLITSDPYTITGLARNTCYDVYVKSVCQNGGSDWVGPASFCTLPDYCAGDRFYDSGGATANYQQYEYRSEVIYPDQQGQRVRAVFNSFEIQRCCDSFRIYNGSDYNAPLLYDSNVQQTAPSTIGSTAFSGALRFEFQANSSQPLSGWDATIFCEPMPPCANMPSLITATTITTNTARISWTENSNATSWEIEVVTAGATPSGSGILSSAAAYTLSGLNVNTCYDVYVRSICTDGISPWSNAYTFCTLPDYCAGDHFYDTGGANGEYQSYENYTKTIYPAQGQRVKAIFNTFALESCCDRLIIYNGPDTTYPVLFSGTGNALPGTFKSTHASGTLTFSFFSDGSVEYDGWDATIICEEMPDCADFPTALTASAIGLTHATIGWSQNSEVLNWEVSIVASGSSLPMIPSYTTNTKPFTIVGLIPDTCYDVYVRAKCSAGNSEWTGPLRFCTAPDYCGGNHFYDSGGVNGNYANGEYKTTVIYPQVAGDKITAVFNSFQMESCCDYMYIYNGPDSSSPLLFSGGYNSPGTVRSTHATGALTFAFYSDSSVTASGWDATINCGVLSNQEFGAFTVLEYYPNPVTNAITIDAKEFIKKYEVYDINGKMLKEAEVLLEKFEIDLSRYPSGTYMIRLSDDLKREKTIKVLKK